MLPASSFSQLCLLALPLALQLLAQSPQSTPQVTPKPTPKPTPQATPKPTPSAGPVPSALPLLADRKPNQWRGDFDDDGQPDTLQIVAIRPNFVPGKQMQMLNFWDKSALKPPQTIALRLQSSREQQEFIIHSAGYFGSPMWRSPEPPLEIVHRGKPLHQFWQRQVEKLKGDGIILGTEAGIDTLLYWDGKTYRLYLPPERP